MTFAQEMAVRPSPSSARLQAGTAGKEVLAQKRVSDARQSSGQPLDAQIRAFMERGFGQDFSGVRVHTGAEAREATRALGAEAFTIGSDIYLGANLYRPASSAGRRLIAHELVHVLQQSGSDQGVQASPADGVSPSQADDPLEREAEAGAVRVMSGETAGPIARRGRPAEASQTAIVQCRRVPSSAHLAAAVPTAAAPLANTSAGVARLLSRSWAALPAAQQKSVKSAAAPLKWTNEETMRKALESASRAQLLAVADAIRTANPAAELGDPALIDVGARPGTSDAANINKLVSNANIIFGAITLGLEDSSIAEVFGSANVATATTKYNNAAAAMNNLKSTDHIVTDRSGYSGEVSLGGLSNSNQIAVASQVIDNPNDRNSVVMLIHEAMHAGNSDVKDFGYIHQPSFTVLTEAIKLTNAAHFEVVPRRLMGIAYAFSGVTFTPAGGTIGGVTTPALTPRETAIRGASERFRLAWTVGLNLHNLFRRVLKTPAEWNTLDLSTAYTGAASGTRFANTLPYWSKVEMLTIHAREAQINPAGTPAEHPVTMIDMALSEGLIRKLAQGMREVPQTPAAAQAFEKNYASAAERKAAAKGGDDERDVLMRLAFRVKLGRLTGDVDRDEKAVARLALAGSAPNFSDYLQVRTAASFP